MKREVLVGMLLVCLVGGTSPININVSDAIAKAMPTPTEKPKIISFSDYDWIVKDYEEKYLFSWDNVPGKEIEKLRGFLRDELNIDWAKNAEFFKTDDGKTIRIFKDENSAEIIIDEKNEKATLKISDGRTYDLKVKTEMGKLNIYKDKTGPGPNYWSAENVWKDKQGRLHLKITNRNGKWYCAEVYTKEPLGYGEYVFYVTGRVDKLDQQMDKNVVVGLFNYLDDEHEIDIEFTKAWMDENAQYAVKPDILWGPGRSVEHFNMNLDNSPETEKGKSTHKFMWNSNSIIFTSIYGHHREPPEKSDVIHHWEYEGGNIPKTESLKTHINLFLFQGKEPSDEDKEVEIIIEGFEFREKEEREEEKLRVPYFNQGNTVWCAVTTLTMVMRYYGETAHTWDVARDLGINRPKKGLTWGDIVAGPFESKVEKYVKGKGFSFTQHYLLSKEDIKKYIDEGKPVIVNIVTEKEGIFSILHSIVIVGYKEIEGKLYYYVHDPSGALVKDQLGKEKLAMVLIPSDKIGWFHIGCFLVISKEKPNPPEAVMWCWEYSFEEKIDEKHYETVSAGSTSDNGNIDRIVIPSEGLLNLRAGVSQMAPHSKRLKLRVSDKSSPEFVVQSYGYSQPMWGVELDTAKIALGEHTLLLKLDDAENSKVYVYDEIPIEIESHVVPISDSDITQLIDEFIAWWNENKDELFKAAHEFVNEMFKAIDELISEYQKEK